MPHAVWGLQIANVTSLSVGILEILITLEILLALVSDAERKVTPQKVVVKTLCVCYAHKVEISTQLPVTAAQRTKRLLKNIR